ncbi:D-2-hydroxyacid dehydrogenase [Luxibacter massiliensis]|uniref:D-2-hydroxyacid dehydrogenase n=1 Tax=Luxibacter massiliensis TaxID=2219695 RepID=UPI000F06AD47|nr:D-2-hydroxyacid dehydrogenase [Luxibacter massiliensis]
MKIVFLDAKTIGEDLDLSPFDKLGEVIKYPFSSAKDVPERVRDADVVILNKVQINEQTIHTAGQLKLVCVTATGTNNLDKKYLEERGIAWRNVAGYSTQSVAQHTFAMLFYLLEKLPYYDQYVKSRRYVNDTFFTHFEQVFHQLNSMTWGIIGLGSIGRRVADIARMFGARVIYCSPSGAPPQPGYDQVSFHDLLASSDIISVHAPLNKFTENLLDEQAFRQMRPHTIFLNLGRGQIVAEDALAAALKHHWIAAAGLDVLAVEPMSEDSPLLDLIDNPNLFITPHIGWASIEARTQLISIIAGQISDFFSQI